MKIPLFNLHRQNQIASNFWQLRKEGMKLNKLVEQKTVLLNARKRKSRLLLDEKTAKIIGSAMLNQKIVSQIRPTICI